MAGFLKKDIKRQARTKYLWNVLREHVHQEIMMKNLKKIKHDIYEADHNELD